jgi:hypothetical protein
MRIVKLSDAETGLGTLDGVRRFFLEELRHRMPPGKFQVTPGRIAQDGLSPGELLLFTYRARIVFTARAGSGLEPSHGDESQKYPHYFLVNLATLREADEDFHDVERWYIEATGADVHLVQSQGWSRLPDSIHTNQLWERLRDATAFKLPEEVIDQAGLIEGATRTISINSYERNPEARQRCIEHYGPSCSVCGLNFAAVYGAVAEGFIHVHHLRSLADIRAEYVVDPVKDLRPVCPNCHAVLHRRVPQYAIEEVRDLLRRRSGV